MVSSMTLLKWRERENVSHIIKDHNYAESLHSASPATIKKQDHTKNTEKLCRVCLKNGNISIYGNSKIDISHKLRIFAGILVGNDDGYPKHLCKYCHDVLQRAVWLRNTAQQSMRVLNSSIHEESILHKLLREGALNENELHDDNYLDIMNQMELKKYLYDTFDKYGNPLNENEHCDDNVFDNKNQMKKHNVNEQNKYHCNTFAEYENHRLSGENKKTSYPVTYTLYGDSRLKNLILLHNSENPLNENDDNDFDNKNQMKQNKNHCATFQYYENPLNKNELNNGNDMDNKNQMENNNVNEQKKYHCDTFAEYENENLLNENELHDDNDFDNKSQMKQKKYHCDTFQDYENPWNENELIDGNDMDNKNQMEKHNVNEQKKNHCDTFAEYENENLLNENELHDDNDFDNKSQMKQKKYNCDTFQDYENPFNENELIDGNDMDNKNQMEKHNVNEQKKYHCDTFAEYENHRLSGEIEDKKTSYPVAYTLYGDSRLRNLILLHNSDGPFVCDICGRKVRDRCNFVRHHSTHFNNLPFKCTQCPYQGRFKQSLNMHMRFHTGYKPYQCLHCPSQFFVNKSNLSRHHLVVHKRDRSFKCDPCQRAFYTRRELNIHFKVDHMGIKEHSCDVCGKEFGARNRMTRHQLRVHKRQNLLRGRAPLYLRAAKEQEEVS